MKRYYRNVYVLCLIAYLFIIELACKATTRLDMLSSKKSTPITHQYYHVKEFIGNFKKLKFNATYTLGMYQVFEINRLKRASEILDLSIRHDNCFLNASARAIILLGSDDMDRYEYENFMEQFYASRGARFKTMKDFSCMGGICTTGIGMLCLFMGIPLGAPLAKAGGGLTASGIATLISSFTIGRGCDFYKNDIPMLAPSPWDISEYMNSYLANKYGKAVVHCFDHFYQFQRFAKENKKTNKKPLLVILFLNPSHWHYVNIVGRKISSLIDPPDWIVLETNGAFYAVKDEALKVLMRNKYSMMTQALLWQEPNHKYYAIGFQPRRQRSYSNQPSSSNTSYESDKYARFKQKYWDTPSCTVSSSNFASSSAALTSKPIFNHKYWNNQPK